MDFSFEKHISDNQFVVTPSLDLFGVSQLDAASYEPPAAASITPGGKQKKPKKRRSLPGDGSKPYPTIKCTECPKTYRDNAACHRHLQLHMTTHDPEAQAKFKCEKCSKTFSNEVYLKRHFNLCGAPRRRRSSVGSSTHDESSSDSAAVAVAKKLDEVKTIDEECDGEVQLDFLAF